MNISMSDNEFFERAIRLALEAEKVNNLPIGAVICLDGRIIAEGKNAIWYPRFDPTRHAEIEALRSVPGHLWENSRQMILYSTLEPCLMCMGALIQARIEKLIFGAHDPRAGAAGSICDFSNDRRLNHHMEVASGVLEAECRQLLQRFFRSKR